MLNIKRSIKDECTRRAEIHLAFMSKMQDWLNSLNVIKASDKYEILSVRDKLNIDMDIEFIIYTISVYKLVKDRNLIS